MNTWTIEEARDGKVIEIEAVTREQATALYLKERGLVGHFDDGVRSHRSLQGVIVRRGPWTIVVDGKPVATFLGGILRLGEA